MITPEKRKLYYERFIATHPDYWKKYRRKYYKKNRQVIIQQALDWYYKNRERAKARAKEYYRMHREVLLQKAKELYHKKVKEMLEKWGKNDLQNDEKGF